MFIIHLHTYITVYLLSISAFKQSYPILQCMLEITAKTTITTTKTTLASAFLIDNVTL